MTSTNDNNRQAGCRDEAAERDLEWTSVLVDRTADPEVRSEDDFVTLEMPDAGECTETETVQSGQSPVEVAMVDESAAPPLDQEEEQVRDELEKEQVRDELKEEMSDELEEEQAPEAPGTGPGQAQNQGGPGINLEIDPKLPQEEQTKLVNKIASLLLSQSVLEEQQANLQEMFNIAARRLAAAKAKETTLANERDALYNHRSAMYTHRSRLYVTRGALYAARGAIYEERGAAYSLRGVAISARPRDESWIKEIEKEIAAIDRKIGVQDSKIRDQDRVITDWDREISKHDGTIATKDTEIADYSTVVASARKVYDHEYGRLAGKAQEIKEVARALVEARNKLAGRADPEPVIIINYLSDATTTTLNFAEAWEGPCAVTFHKDGALAVAGGGISMKLGPRSTWSPVGSAFVSLPARGWDGLKPIEGPSASITINDRAGVVYALGCRVSYQCDGLTDKLARLNVTCGNGRRAAVSGKNVLLTLS